MAQPRRVFPNYSRQSWQWIRYWWACPWRWIPYTRNTSARSPDRPGEVCCLVYRYESPLFIGLLPVLYRRLNPPSTFSASALVCSMTLVLHLQTDPSLDWRATFWTTFRKEKPYIFDGKVRKQSTDNLAIKFPQLCSIRHRCFLVPIAYVRCAAVVSLSEEHNLSSPYA